MALSAAPTSFLDPTVLARIDNLELLARIVVDGFVNGLHRSPYKGVSTDFAEHRAYMPGDDIRRVDWRVYARTDRFYIKQFEAETNADVAFLLDVSASMGYGSSDVTKLDYARFLTASLAYFSARQRDRVGLYAFDHDVTEYVRPSSAHLDKILHAVARVKPEREGRWEEPLARVANTFHRRGILVVLSDFYDDPDEITSTLGSLKAQGHDVVAFHVLDAAEVDFPFAKASNFQDLETKELLPVVPEKLASEYQAQISAHTETLAKLFGRNGIDYVLLNTSEPLDGALYKYLMFRQKTMKAR
ncbi:MAG: DUF58 domain-containing protein [Longimicrobiales bacterium]